MGWFDEQIRQRVENDEEVFEDALAQMENAVDGSRKIRETKGTGKRMTEEALQDILNYYHVKVREVPEHITDINEILEYLMRPSGVMRRRVMLKKGWSGDASGAMLGRLVSGESVALLPGVYGGYYYREPRSGKRIRVSRKTEGFIEEEAVVFYKPFPLRPMGGKDLLSYIFRLMRKRDYVLVFALAAAAAGIGMLIPVVSRRLYSDVLVYGSTAFLCAMVTVMACVTLAEVLMEAARTSTWADMQTRIGMAVESAVMMRILSLPPDFFKKYSVGELAGRVSGVRPLCSMLFQSCFSAGLSAVFSLVYVAQILAFIPELALPALVVTVLTALTALAAVMLQAGLSEREMEEENRERGIAFELIRGITKIKCAGAEKRAFAQWAKRYAKEAGYRYAPPLFLKLAPALSAAASLVGAGVLYLLAWRARVDVADYMAFASAYAMTETAFSALLSEADSIAGIRAVLRMLAPVLGTGPEVEESRQVVTRLSGGIELNNVSFRYGENMPYVLNDFSLKIRPGEYVAIVGKTGCGKSTLMRLMLGFERPERGAVYYDGQDLSALDLRSLRRRVGAVMQDGRLFQGDIYSNITASAPWLTEEDAWKAAELAGVAEDIRNMPMGMNTLISEGQGGISGGQRQRLLIARAIAAKRRILIFDEATSALDNVTQKQVSESLDRMKCTRIVIAHRLSTIRHCDRIVVLDKGKTAEEGTYEELLKKKGIFAALVARQTL